MSERLKIITPKKKFEIHKKTFEVVGLSDETPLRAIEPIEQGGISVETREDLVVLVEAPLLEACQHLYDKNIKTIMSSANKKDITSGKVYIAIDFDSLSPKNQEIAKSLGEMFMMHGASPKPAINLEIPVDQDTTIAQVKIQAKELVEKFQQQ